MFVPGSKRYVSTRQAKRLKALLSPRIQAVGVFANAEPETVAGLLDRGVIDLAQLHGGESGDYIRRLRALTGKPIIQAFRITSAQDVMRAETSIADHILLDSGAESFATRSPIVSDLVKELGLGDQIVTPNSYGSWLYLPQAARRTPSTGIIGHPRQCER